MHVDNCITVLPLIKENYNQKFIELDFSQNLSLRPKDEVKSAHFSGKQFTLHCATVESVENQYDYHLSNDSKHDGIFADQVFQDMISVYEIQNEDLLIQSDKVPSQYKNKIPFVLLQQLANELLDIWCCRSWQKSHRCYVKFWRKEYPEKRYNYT